MTSEPATPRGIGTGVAFDWALTVEFVVLAAFQVAGQRGLDPSGAHIGQRVTPLVGATLAASALPLLLGEGLRRGYRWAWVVQLAVTSAAAIGGVALIPSTLGALRSGDGWPLIPTLVLVTIAPVTAWRLGRPATRAWIARADRAEARRRHGGLWLAQTGSGATVGGVLVALAVVYG